ncbi:helix-turn-helix transcriptional regulator [Clostridia bacterium]|nr:helix-turn-helix transcriptional regulator [Clostridia bacterium]
MDRIKEVYNRKESTKSSSIGENIRTARKRKGLNQKELADKLGRTKNVISNWERGDNQPDVEMIARLCSILDVTPNWLLSWNTEPETIDTIAAHNSGITLTQEEQEKVREFAKFLKSQRKG